MYKKTVILLGTGLFIWGCNPSTRKPDSTTLEFDSIPVSSRHTEIVLPNDSGIVNLALVNGRAKVTTHKDSMENVYFVFDSEGYRKLYAKLSSSDSTANIRFSQISMPDGSMDGPFGSEMNYDLPLNGMYMISVHENMMAGDPWGGDFMVEIELR